MGFSPLLGVAEVSVPPPGPGEALQGGSWVLWHPGCLHHHSHPRQHAAELLPRRDSQVSLGSPGPSRAAQFLQHLLNGPQIKRGKSSLPGQGAGTR